MSKLYSTGNDRPTDEKYMKYVYSAAREYPVLVDGVLKMSAFPNYSDGMYHKFNSLNGKPSVANHDTFTIDEVTYSHRENFHNHKWEGVDDAHEKLSGILPYSYAIFSSGYGEVTVDRTHGSIEMETSGVWNWDRADSSGYEDDKHQPVPEGQSLCGRPYYTTPDPRNSDPEG